MSSMGDLGRLFVFAGLALAAAGAVLLVAGRLGARRFPGTLVVSGRHGTFVFPILLCVLLSIVLTIVLSLWRR
jgi:hypothetical protein